MPGQLHGEPVGGRLVAPDAPGREPGELGHDQELAISPDASPLLLMAGEQAGRDCGLGCVVRVEFVQGRASPFEKELNRQDAKFAKRTQRRKESLYRLSAYFSSASLFL